MNGWFDKFLYGDGEEDGREFVEPVTIEETYPNDLGEWDLRLNYEYRRTDTEEENKETHSVPRTQLFFGIFDRLGVDIEVPYLVKKAKSEETEEGIGDISFGLKYLLLDEGPKQPAILLGTEVGAPTGSEKEENEDHNYVSPGVKFNLTEEIFLSVRGPIGLTDDSDDYRIVSQIQIGW